MKILVGIPVLTGPEHTREAIESVLDYSGADLLIIDNGSGLDMKEMLSRFNNTRIYCIENPVNIYVNPAWNQIIKHFLERDYDQLLIMNSDLILCPDWYEVIKKHSELFPNHIAIPNLTNDKSALVKTSGEYLAVEVFEGTPGVLISLNQEQAKEIYPIPETIKVWFGDNWIYEGLRKKGYRTFVLSNLVGYHSGSQTVSQVPGISEIIEQDKVEWEKLK